MDDIEIKLLRLALDKGAPEGEYSNAAVKLISRMRARHATVEDFYKSREYHAREIMPFGKYKCEYIDEIPFSCLVWVLENCENISLALKHAIQNIVNSE